jgi:glycosyltransferase involved in cell wall biosynthesis
VAYVGTLHDERLDVPLALAIADDESVGTLHLVGPDALSEASRDRVLAHSKIRLEGRVTASQVPGWMLAMDVLLCPHLITEFTLSLDAIKAHEYLATGKPIVATPTSGFQELGQEPNVILRTPEDFVSGVREAVHMRRVVVRRTDLSWEARAREFATALADGCLTPQP